MEEGGIAFTDEVRAEIAAPQARHPLLPAGWCVDLAGFFDVEPTLDAVLAARNAAVEADYSDYVPRSTATPASTRSSATSASRCRCSTSPRSRSELPVEIVPIYRIEPLIADLLKTDIGWAEFKRRYDDAITDALTTGATGG